MKTDLDLKFIKGLSLEQIPSGYDAKQNLAFKANPRNRADGTLNPDFVVSYIIWDSNRAAPPGFGIRVAGKKTYVIRRKVRGKSIMPTVGNFADFLRIEDARKKAAELASKMVATGKNPNETARMLSAEELTVGQAFAMYRAHLVNRQQKPATKETLRVYDRAANKHIAWGWDKRKVRDLTTTEIMKKFAEGNAFPSANEQAFRWPTAAIRWCIEFEALAASAERRAPTLTANPFMVLTLNKQYRTSEQIEREREEKSKRNPLRPTTTLGPFLEAAWSKKDGNDNATGVHYLMLMLLWGCRKAEHAKTMWLELLKEHSAEEGVGRRVTSHVCLRDDEDWGPYVFFYKTKNGLNHRLPITPMALELLKRRQILAAEEVVRRGFETKSRKFVFPARSKLSNSGHYSDATDLLDELRQEINLEKLSNHDLRRSFGAVMASLDVPGTIKRRFFNHGKMSVTDTYTQAEWQLLREWMEKIEQAILIRAPNVYNSLKPAAWPPLSAPEPHVCRPPALRTGRPKKAELAVAGVALKSESMPSGI